MSLPEESSYKSERGVRRLVHALGFSLEGLWAAFQHERAFRQLVGLAVVMIPVAFFVHTTPFGRVLLISSILATLVIELLNSAIEAAVDHTSLERHPLAKRAKDMASAAQLFGLLNLVMVWAVVLLH